MTAIGSLFSGYGGLDMGVQAAIGGRTAWVSDVDPGACKILAHRYPGVPNIGDITAVQWDQVEPVDVLTGGFPCQDVSAAGKRLGMKPGTRSGLWSHMAYAIDKLRPSLVVAENVRGLLSASAHSELEPCPWCLGDGGDVSLRALGGVLGDLADLGYDASWQGLRASDVGAPHGRFRVFVVAWPAGGSADALGSAGRPEQPGCIEPGSEEGVVLEAGRGTRRGGGARDRANAAADTLGQRPERWGGHGDVACSPGAGEGHEGERERHGNAVDDRGAAAADSSRKRRDKGPRCDAHPDQWRQGDDEPGWGPYAGAVRRWERLTRLAPAPTEPGKVGQPRLSPAFVEWLMGLPAGHVTQVPGLTRNEQLKALGNGVVPQQAAEALRLLLPDVRAVAA